MTNEEAWDILDAFPHFNGEKDTQKIYDAVNTALRALQKPDTETEVLRKIQQDCKQKLTCTGCRFQGRDDDGFTICKVHFPECWIIDEQEAAADE